MPDFPIVDAHVHLWNPRLFRMGWLDGNAILDRPYGLAEYREHTAGVAIEALVYLQVEVEPAYGLLEARWAAERAAEEPRLRAIVAWAPTEFGEQSRAYLDALVATTPLIKGVRRLIQGEADPDFAARPRFVRGVQLLAEYGLSFDLCITHQQLPSVIELVRQCPAVAFVLDHIGKPDIKGHLLDPWRERIAALAAYPNVMCKLSGMVTEADHAAWTPEDLAPYVAQIVATFGEERIMYGGDWPVAFQAAPYPPLGGDPRRPDRRPVAGGEAQTLGGKCAALLSTLGPAGGRTSARGAPVLGALETRPLPLGDRGGRIVAVVRQQGGGLGGEALAQGARLDHPRLLPPAEEPGEDIVLASHAQGDEEPPVGIFLRDDVVVARLAHPARRLPREDDAHDHPAIIVAPIVRQAEVGGPREVILGQGQPLDPIEPELAERMTLVAIGDQIPRPGDVRQAIRVGVALAQDLMAGVLVARVVAEAHGAAIEDRAAQLAE